VHVPDDALTLEGKPMKDANEAFLKKLDLKKLINKAEPLMHSQIATFKDFKSEVLRELRYPNEV